MLISKFGSGAALHVPRRNGVCLCPRVDDGSNFGEEGWEQAS